MYLTHPNLDKFWITDIEADGLKATKIHVVCAINAATGELLTFRDPASYRAFLEADSDTILVGHNFLSYDMPTLRRLWAVDVPDNRIVDTLVLSYLYDPRMYGGHSLEAWGERMKYPKIEHSDWSEYSPAMLERCIGDVNLNLLVFRALTKRMRGRGFSERSCKLEHEIRVVCDKQQDYGFWFDIPGAEELFARLRVEQEALSGPIRELFPPVLVSNGSYAYRTRGDGQPYASFERHLAHYPRLVLSPDQTSYEVFDYQEFNIGSPKQRLEKLLSVGFVPQKFTKKKNPSVDEDSLVDFANSSGIKEAQAIADWLVLFGRANMIGTWLNNVNREDSRMHGRVFSCGASSRRMTHASPNTANIPGVDAKYGFEVRSLWGVEDKINRRQVGVDAKSIQMRCFANVLPDPNEGQRYWDTDFCPDPHQENADIIGIKRKPSKNVFFANLFGAYPPKLASTAGRSGTKKELAAYGAWIQEQMYTVTPGLKEATEAAKDEWRQNQGFLLCPDGGYVRCPDESAALNYKIQPAEAVVMKLANIKLDKLIDERGWDAHQMASVHDEWQYDVPKNLAEEFGGRASDCIRDAGEELGFRVPLAGEACIGVNWAEAH